MTPDLDRPAGAGRRYLAAVAGWLAGAFAGPVAATAAVAAWMTHVACADDATDCSWGFEYLLVVPVWLACLLGVGPWMVGRAFRAWVDPARERRARRVTAGSAVASVLVLYGAASGGGVGGFTSSLGVVVVGVPALVAWATRRRPAAARGAPD